MNGTQSSPNPYASPDSREGDGPGLNVGEGAGEFGNIIRHWERLRLYYNGSLAIVVLAFTALIAPQLFFMKSYWVAVIFGAFIANLCFFIGPALEGYGMHFRWWRPALTILLFLAGLVLTTLLALVSVVSIASARGLVD